MDEQPKQLYDYDKLIAESDGLYHPGDAAKHIFDKMGVIYGKRQMG
jgi:hypothetical protein